mgnify:FL=1
MKCRKIIGAGICVCLCMTVLAVLDPLGAKSQAPAADMMAMDEVKSEISMAQGTECTPDYGVAGAAPMENEAAAVEAEERPAVEPAAVRIACGTEEITLDVSDSAVIMEYLSSDQWIPTAANCLCDYTLHVNGLTYRYHSDCGTIQDESGQSLTLSEEDKLIFNEIVGRCPMRIDE